MQRTFFVHFFAVVLHDYNVKLPETSSFHVLWRKCHTCSCSLSLHFTLPLIFTLMAASISHFLTAVEKFSCCSRFQQTMSTLFLVCNHVTRRPCWGSKQKNISSKNLHENRNAFVLDHQHGRRDVTSKAKIRRARLGKGGGGGGPVSPQLPRVFFISFYRNDFSPLSRSLEQASDTR